MANRASRHRARLIHGIALAIIALPVASASAQGDPAWKKEREARFAAVKAAHPPQDATIAEIKAKTAALIAADGAAGVRAVDAAPIVWRTNDVPVVVFDVPVGPRMVVVPAGEYAMGSSPGEVGRGIDEAPRHRVRLAHAFAVSMFPITYGEYAWFVGETGHRSSSCVTVEAGRRVVHADRDWRNPGFAQTPRSPATCIGYGDAVAYAAWLSNQTGQKYRLLSEAEYEYANRAGTTTAYWWGNDRDAGCKLVNGLDRAAGATSNCDDGFAFTAPLDTSKANPFGLFDTTGNVASWTADCWHAHPRIGANGVGRAPEKCAAHVVRGGSWASPPADLRAAARGHDMVDQAMTDRGFRVARDL